jgi:hypothetical protein
MADPEDTETDGQDLAEVFDEENITEDGRDIATSDMQRDVFDATSVPEDATDALEPQDDFDPDAADEAELEEIVLADEDLDEPRTFAQNDADLVSGDNVSTADLEAGEAEERGPDALDEALDERFAADDARPIDQRSD